MRGWFVAAVLSTALSVDGRAQTRTTTQTTCSRAYADVLCNSQSRTTASPRCTNVYACALMGLQQGRADAAEQERQDQERILELQRLQLLTAEIGRRTADRQRDDDARRAAREAQIRAYTRRLNYLIPRARDSIGLFGAPANEFGTDVTEPVSDLFAANPLATNADISEAIKPIVEYYAIKSQEYSARAKSTLKLVADSLHLTTAERPRFYSEAGDVLLRQAGVHLNTSVTEMRNAIWPLTIDAAHRHIASAALDTVRHGAAKAARKPRP